MTSSQNKHFRNFNLVHRLVYSEPFSSHLPLNFILVTIRANRMEGTGRSFLKGTETQDERWCYCAREILDRWAHDPPEARKVRRAANKAYQLPRRRSLLNGEEEWRTRVRRRGGRESPRTGKLISFNLVGGSASSERALRLAKTLYGSYWFPRISTSSVTCIRRDRETNTENPISRPSPFYFLVPTEVHSFQSLYNRCVK